MTKSAQQTAGGKVPVRAPYGSWASPITARLIAESDVTLGALQAVAGQLFWVEMRPLDEGRSALVRCDADGRIADVTPAGADVRTLVHEYGGGQYALHARAGGGVTVFYSELADQRLYRLDVSDPSTAGATIRSEAGAGGERDSTAPRAITPRPRHAKSLRYADACVSPDGSTLICVRERHGSHGVVNELVTLPADGSSEPHVLVGGHDFFAAPRLSPDGDRLAWLCWDHPRMPWDGTELWVAEVTAAGALAAPRRVAGGPSESVLQPAWSAAGRLHFVSDRSGWWNLYAVGDSGSGPATALAPAFAEFARPPWQFGLQNYRFMEDGRIVAFFSRHGVDSLCFIDPSGTDAAGDGRPTDRGLSPIPCPLTACYALAAAGDRLAAIAGSATRGAAVVTIDPVDGSLREVRCSSHVDVDPAYVSAPEPIAFPTSYEAESVTGPLAEEIAGLAADPADPGDAPQGRPGEPPADGPLTAYALYYPPANEDFAGPLGERPPLIVMSHGGPTSSADAQFSLEVQFWTSRGIAVVDVDYGGSCGYGRAYRRRLNGNWGIVDTVDCINAALFLAARDDVDPARMAVEGGSAGGYTTLNALTRHHVFAAGASYFGVADLEDFAKGGTHKFEAQYLIGLVGPYPEQAHLYRERSPINHVSDIACPVILFQGLQDPIVPPSQAELIVTALEEKRLPYAYLAFPGEQHGFRKAKNIERSQEAELYFYGRVFGFTPADPIEPLEIVNLA